MVNHTYMLNWLLCRVDLQVVSAPIKGAERDGLRGLVKVRRLR
jgi:hypothetical protein